MCMSYYNTIYHLVAYIHAYSCLTKTNFKIKTTPEAILLVRSATTAQPHIMIINYPAEGTKNTVKKKMPKNQPKKNYITFVTAYIIMFY
jgi:hypothetical protein